ncbi:hypothetical protein SDC9_90553 [bioreactor metagenome]|uniref:Uncharacterized protein n=1 Tax=bioreactor metagenome TaxID=1076179 RepID=A0A644ZT01_9ZZZZ
MVVAGGVAQCQHDLVIGAVLVQALAPVVIAEPIFEPLFAVADLLEVLALERKVQGLLHRLGPLKIVTMVRSSSATDPLT